MVELKPAPLCSLRAHNLNQMVGRKYKLLVVSQEIREGIVVGDNVSIFTLRKPRVTFFRSQHVRVGIEGEILSPDRQLEKVEISNRLHLLHTPRLTQARSDLNQQRGRLRP